MLAEERGRIVPFRNSRALAEQVIDLLDNEVARHAIRKRAYTFCRDMVWKEVARSYLKVFAEARNDRSRFPRPTLPITTQRVVPVKLPRLRFDHLYRLTDDVGILQHANFIVPDRFNGYCTDDNARALIVVLMALNQVYDEGPMVNLSSRYLSFLHYALNESNGRFRNLMSYDRRWSEERGSEDSHGRAIWSLGMVVALSKWDSLTAVAVRLFERALPVLHSLRSPRSWAFGLVGANAYLKRYSGDSEVRRLRDDLANRLLGLFQENASEEWPWPEEEVTYANGKIPQALIGSGYGLQRQDMIEAGLRSLQWLLKIQSAAEGHFVPIGTSGWFPRTGRKARFDQQPVEAQNMIEGCMEAYRVSRDKKWMTEAQRCFEWFLGRNDIGTPLHDYETGGCCDGLSADGPSQNQGAESTLAWLISLLNMYAMRDWEASTEVSEIASEESRPLKTVGR
jgi:hypothetical protein